MLQNKKHTVISVFVITFIILKIIKAESYTFMLYLNETLACKKSTHVTEKQINSTQGSLLSV